MNEFNTADIAKRLKVHDNTIRDWTKRFSGQLSDKANNPKRKYTDEDVLVLATVAEMRDKGISFELIEEMITKGQLIEEAPPIPLPEDEEARQDVDIVHIPRDTYLLEQERLIAQVGQLSTRIENLEGQLQQSETENKELRTELSEAREKLGELRGKLGTIETSHKQQLGTIEDAHKKEVSAIQAYNIPVRQWLLIVLIIAVSAILVTAGMAYLLLQ